MILEVDDLISQLMRGKPLYIHPVYKLQCTSVHLVPTIELKFQNRSQFFGKTGNEVSSTGWDPSLIDDIEEEGRQHQDLGRQQSFPKTDPHIWVGQAK